MFIGLIVLALSLLFYFILSAAILYHIWCYSPDSKSGIILMVIFLGVSILLIVSALVAFGEINWRELG